MKTSEALSLAKCSDRHFAYPDIRFLDAKTCSDLLPESQCSWGGWFNPGNRWLLEKVVQHVASSHPPGQEDLRTVAISCRVSGPFGHRVAKHDPGGPVGHAAELANDISSWCCGSSLRSDPYWKRGTPISVLPDTMGRNPAGVSAISRSRCLSRRKRSQNDRLMQ